MKAGNDENKLWRRIAIVMAIGFAVMFGWGIVADYRLDHNHRFTVATTVGKAGGGWVDFEFDVNGKTHSGGDKGLSLNPRKAKYFVKYYVLDPSIHEVVSSDPVPDCIGEPPPEGWEEIPSCR